MSRALLQGVLMSLQNVQTHETLRSPHRLTFIET